MEYWREREKHETSLFGGNVHRHEKQEREREDSNY